MAECTDEARRLMAVVKQITSPENRTLHVSLEGALGADCVPSFAMACDVLFPQPNKSVNGTHVLLVQMLGHYLIAVGQLLANGPESSRKDGGDSSQDNSVYQEAGNLSWQK